jgi:glycosyltransferase involved in cell wall biosynthesis
MNSDAEPTFTHRNERDVAALIPALNCEQTVGDVVRGARRYVSCVLVVSDGSTDATEERARNAGAEVLRHETVCGKGAALLTGMQALAARGIERVLTMDGDGQHLADEIPVLLQASGVEPKALVLGARQMAPEMSTPARLFGNRFANRWVEIACGQALPDTQSGFRVYPLQETLALEVKARHFGFETEVLIRAVRAGLAIRSVPVRVFYPPPDERVSHFHPFVDTVRIICIVLGLIFRVY